METRGKSDLGLGLFFGVVIGLVVGGAVAGIVTSTYLRKSVQKGWSLVPVVVAATDIPEGTRVTYDMISQRSVPEQFVTSSAVKPDGASYIVNQPVTVPIQAGDMLLWSQFSTGPETDLATCLQQVKEARDARGKQGGLGTDGGSPPR
jgi:Flp pilus assembly protein CpaB